MDWQISRRGKALAVLLLGLAGLACLVGAPDAVGALVSARPTRRTALFTLPALTSVFLPRPARAVCSCPSGLDSCVCTADDPAKVAERLARDPSGKKRADAAGREMIAGQQERVELGLGSQVAAPAKVQAKAPKAAPGVAPAVASPVPESYGVQPGYLGLSGGGDLGDVSVQEAKARFAKIVLETKLKREAQFGFELEPEDVRQIADSLRPKYCGQFGLIGPC